MSANRHRDVRCRRRRPSRPKAALPPSWGGGSADRRQRGRGRGRQSCHAVPRMPTIPTNLLQSGASVRRRNDLGPDDLQELTRRRRRLLQTPIAEVVRRDWSRCPSRQRSAPEIRQMSVGSSATPAVRLHMQSGANPRLDVDAACDGNARETIFRRDRSATLVTHQAARIRRLVG
jgi:hypothetical protein